MDVGGVFYQVVILKKKHDLMIHKLDHQHAHTDCMHAADCMLY